MPKRFIPFVQNHFKDDVTFPGLVIRHGDVKTPDTPGDIVCNVDEVCFSPKAGEVYFLVERISKFADGIRAGRNYSKVDFDSARIPKNRTENPEFWRRDLEKEVTVAIRKKLGLAA